MTGIFIVARLGSSRLPRKHLIEAAGKTFIEWLVERFCFSFKKEISEGGITIFIVTSESEENKEFESLFKNNELKVFYGADSNIPLRQWQCAQAYNVTEIVSVDGDDILCSTHGARIARESLIKDAIYVKTVGLPLGMNTIGYTTEFLRKSLTDHSDATLETGWGRIFNDSLANEIRLGNYDEDKRLRLTLDYNEDAIFFKTVIDLIGEKIINIDDKALIELIIANNLYAINDVVSERYWKNFLFQKNSER